MLHYIIPPIIMVASLAALLVFLFKKFSNVENVSQDVMDRLSGKIASKSFSKKVLSAISHVWLRILERLMQKTKLFSLKLHNTSNTLFHSIKNKREQSKQEITEVTDAFEGVPVIDNKEIIKEDLYEDKQEAGLIEKMSRFSRIKKQTVANDGIVESTDVASARRSFFARAGKQKMESVAVHPVKKKGMEEDLIKRIAMNPKDIEAYERLGDYYADLGNLRDAVQCYKQVLKLSPGNGKAKVKIRSLETVLKR